MKKDYMATLLNHTGLTAVCQDQRIADENEDPIWWDLVLAFSK